MMSDDEVVALWIWVWEALYHTGLCAWPLGQSIGLFGTVEGFSTRLHGTA